jgi:hypothetical protein
MNHMLKRNFSIGQRSIDKAGRPIMDLPFVGILRYFRPEALIKEFETTWGVSPEAVVLPVTYSDGILFDVEGLNDLSSPNARISEEYKEFKDVVYAFASRGKDIYLLMDPTLQFVRTSALFVVDIVRDTSSSVCIGNPSSREVIAAILGTAVDEAVNATLHTSGKLKGVVISAINLWPMGAVNQRLELTCFCPSCQAYFNDENDKLLPYFNDFPNPWNLLLKDSGTGVSFIDDIKKDSTADFIVGMSRQKGFHTIFEDREKGELYKYAEILIDYIRIRHEQTIFAINEVLSTALNGLPDEYIPSKILLIEGSYYNWTSGIQLERLDRPQTDNTINPYDEIWFNPTSTDLYMRHVPFRSYMWKRSRYYIDAFLQLSANISDPVKRATTGISRYSKEQALELLESRLRQALGMAMVGQTSLFALPDLESEKTESKRVGFVGVALNERIGKAIIDGITPAKGTRSPSKPEDFS